MGRENQSSINFKDIPGLNSEDQILPELNIVDMIINQSKMVVLYLIWDLKWLIYTLFELKSLQIRGVNLIMSQLVPKLT